MPRRRALTPSAIKPGALALAFFVAAAAGATALPGAGADPAQPQPRIVTLAPHATELVYAAGGGDLIVGTVSSSDFPESARDLPRVGDGIILNQERLIVLQPTLILAWDRFGAAVQAESLAPKLGAQMVYAAPSRLRDIPDQVRRIGRQLGRSPLAEQAASAMEARIDTLEDRYSERAPVTVFVEVGSLPLYTIGGDPLLNDAMRICGAINIYGATPIPAPQVPIESVLVHDPQLIVTPARPGESTEDVRARWAGYGLTAAQEGRVHAADPDALFRPGPRFIEATQALCEAVDSARPPDVNAPPAGR